MIKESNFREVLKTLHFKHDSKNDIFSKVILDSELRVDFKNKILHYPEEIIIHDKTTSNFSHPENFVVFECVHRLLEKGYKPNSLELEPRWNLRKRGKGWQGRYFSARLRGESISHHRVQNLRG